LARKLKRYIVIIVIAEVVALTFISLTIKVPDFIVNIVRKRVQQEVEKVREEAMEKMKEELKDFNKSPGKGIDKDALKKLKNRGGR